MNGSEAAGHLEVHGIEVVACKQARDVLRAREVARSLDLILPKVVKEPDVGEVVRVPRGQVFAVREVVAHRERKPRQAESLDGERQSELALIDDLDNGVDVRHLRVDDRADLSHDRGGRDERPEIEIGRAVSIRRFVAHRSPAGVLRDEPRRGESRRAEQPTPPQGRGHAEAGERAHVRDESGERSPAAAGLDDRAELPRDERIDVEEHHHPRPEWMPESFYRGRVVDVTAVQVAIEPPPLDPVLARPRQSLGEVLRLAVRPHRRHDPAAGEAAAVEPQPGREVVQHGEERRRRTDRHMDLDVERHGRRRRADAVDDGARDRRQSRHSPPRRSASMTASASASVMSE